MFQVPAPNYRCGFFGRALPTPLPTSDDRAPLRRPDNELSSDESDLYRAFPAPHRCRLGTGFAARTLPIAARCRPDPTVAIIDTIKGIIGERAILVERNIVR